MSQIEIELVKIERQLRQIPDVVTSARVEVAELAAIATELANDATKLIGLKLPYYGHIQEYAEQRALIVENTTSRLNFYNIGNPSSWNTMFTTGFTFPSSSRFVFYTFVFDSNDVPIPSEFDETTMYLVESDTGVLATLTDIATFLKPVEEIVVPDYTVIEEVTAGVTHTVLEFTDPLIEAPTIGQRFAILVDNEVVGYIEVGVEGLGKNPLWDALEDVDLLNPTELDNWYSDMTQMGTQDFSDLCGTFVDGSFIVDDIIVSSDSSIRSDSTRPYSAAKLERSPFFPALNDNEDDYPGDFDFIDVKNRKMTIDGVDQWAVYPQFRWEGKLIPALSANPNSEQITTLYANTSRNSFLNIAVSGTGFPVNQSAANDPRTVYFWNQSDDLIYSIVYVGGIPDPLTQTLISCTYNSMRTKINNWNANFGTFLSNIQTRSTFENEIDNDHAIDDDDFFDLIQEIIDLNDAFLAHHGSWFSPGDDGDISVFDSSIGTYDQSFYNALSDFFVLYDTMFTDRKEHIETVIGSAVSRTGYVGEVINAANLIVHRSFGIVQNLKKDVNALDDVKTLLRKIREKFNAYS